VEGSVITIGHINGGHTYNVIPEQVTMLGTARWFAPEVGDLLERRFLETVTGIAAAFGATAEAKFLRLYPATINEPISTGLAADAARAVQGEARVVPMSKPTMGGEDFSFMLNVKDGAYLMLGGGRGTDDAQVHHPKYDFNDDILPIGASWWAALAERLLPRQG
jgi:hippurate hydrolase